MNIKRVLIITINTIHFTMSEWMKYCDESKIK